MSTIMEQKSTTNTLHTLLRGEKLPESRVGGFLGKLMEDTGVSAIYDEDKGIYIPSLQWLPVLTAPINRHDGNKGWYVLAETESFNFHFFADGTHDIFDHDTGKLVEEGVQTVTHV